MLLRGRHLFYRKITVQYPEEKTPQSVSFRGLHALHRYPNGEARCIACKLCEAVFVTIDAWVAPDSTRCTTRYDIDLFKFVYCGFCKEACPTEGMQHLCQLTLGGTAVGTGVNAHPEFGPRVAALISSKTGIDFVINSDSFEGIATQDAALEMSGHLKALAVSFMKISNDLRWMNSGPLAGPGEITLPLLHPGSSICQSGLVYPDEHNLSALSYHRYVLDSG